MNKLQSIHLKKPIRYGNTVVQIFITYNSNPNGLIRTNILILRNSLLRYRYISEKELNLGQFVAVDNGLIEYKTCNNTALNDLNYFINSQQP
jgi:hypothetical protein